MKPVVGRLLKALFGCGASYFHVKYGLGRIFLAKLKPCADSPDHLGEKGMLASSFLARAELAARLTAAQNFASGTYREIFSDVMR